MLLSQVFSPLKTRLIRENTLPEIVLQVKEERVARGGGSKHMQGRGRPPHAEMH